MCGQCLCCGGTTKQFVSSGRTAKYCSRDCMKRALSGSTLTRSPTPQHYRPLAGVWCVVCMRPTNRSNQVVCSPECRQSLKAARKMSAGLLKVEEVRDGQGCLACGGKTKTFYSSGRSSKFCSDKCRQGYRATAWDKSDRPCDICGNKYTPVTPNQKYCSGECSKNATNDRRKRSGDWVGDHHERRCRKVGVKFTPIAPKDIFERDGYLCHLCLSPCDSTATWPDPLAPTLDHVIPLARGGGHTEENLRCAHWMCNQKKAAKAELWADHEHQPAS